MLHAELNILKKPKGNPAWFQAAQIAKTPRATSLMIVLSTNILSSLPLNRFRNMDRSLLNGEDEDRLHNFFNFM